MVQTNKLKKHILFIGVIVIFNLGGCDKEVDLVIPELFVTPTDAGVLDTVTAVAHGAATIEGEPVQVDSYLWSILDPDGSEVDLLSGDKDSVKWVPLKQGDYLIEVTIKPGNKSVTKTSLSTFKNTIRTFQTALVGQWEGTSNAPYFEYGPRVVHFTIESNGHYSAYMVSEPEPPSGSSFTVLANGSDELDHPGKKIIVDNILSNGQATGTITFVHGGLLTYLFDKMSFSNDYNELNFNSGHFSPEYLHIEYKLTRQH